MFGKKSEQPSVGKVAKSAGVYVLTCTVIYAGIRAGFAIVDLAAKYIGKAMPKATATAEPTQTV